MMEAFNRLSRRMLLMMSRGGVSMTDDTKPVQTIQAQVNQLELIDDLPRFAEYGFTSNPPKGTQVVIAFKNGDRDDGIVIATSNAKYRMTGLATGEVAIHDDTGQSVYLSAAGMILNGGGKPVTITNTPKVRAETPLLECTGDIVDNCDTTGRSMVADRQIYDSHNHNFVAASGSANLTTNVPNQAE
ncbi:MAG: phage baseplate assembly protein V [Pseudomonadota bacterium]|nr:phage baseplate assembly protein V [Pseudomonadota bacterium]